MANIQALVSDWLTRLQARRLNSLQSDILLPTARTLYIALACATVAAAALSLILAAYFQLSSLRMARQQKVPSGAPAGTVAMDMGAISARLAPPTNIRAVAALQAFNTSIKESDVIGHFEADTPNGLGSYPDAFQIVSGRDAGLVETRFDPRQKGDTSIHPSAALIARLAAPPATGTIDIQLNVAAIDAHGNFSAPAAVTLALNFSPSTEAAAAAPVAPPLEDPVSPQLQAIGVAIALIGDPARSEKYIDTYEAAVRVPAKCGASDEPDFVGNYGRALEYAKPMLKEGNLGAFYTGVCDAWHSTLARRAEASAAAQAERARVIMNNEAARAETAFKTGVAKALRNTALIFLLGAIVLFMLIALFLAFLAMEGHSRAMREAVEALARPRIPEKVEP